MCAAYSRHARPWRLQPPRTGNAAPWSPKCDATAFSPDESAKVDFMQRALSEQYTFSKNAALPAQLREAVLWETSRSPAQVMREREAIVRGIEKRAAKLRASGATARWLDGADKRVLGVVCDVNGPLLEELVE